MPALCSPSCTDDGGNNPVYDLLMHKMQQENEQQEECICQKLPGAFLVQATPEEGEKQQMTNTQVEQTKSR